MAKLLSDLPVGSVVKSTNTKYNGRAIRWIVGTKKGGKIGLVSEKILSLKCFDAKEPSNPDGNRKNYGNNRYAQSNIDQWLNSESLNWYSSRHSYDAPPNNNNVYGNYNEYENEAGFLTNFEENFKKAILNTTITIAKNNVVDGGGSENIQRKIFLLSNTEVGLTNENNINEGESWEYFTGNSKRVCKPTYEAVKKSEYTSGSLSENQGWFWWLRTPYASASYGAGIVNADGSLTHNRAYAGYCGVRPALLMGSSNLVSDNADTDGAYILLWNQPPSVPGDIHYDEPQAGKPLILTTSGSTDPDGNAITYVWERKTDSGVYQRIGTTSEKRFTDTVPTSGTTYTARVKSVDSNELESAFRTGETKAISHNTPPVISGSNQMLGAKDEPFTYSYTVTDAQAGQTVTVSEKITNGSNVISLKTHVIQKGKQNTIDLSSVWLTLLEGEHTIIITASDGAGGTAERRVSFNRIVNRVAAARAVSTDALVKKMFLSLYPSVLPPDTTLHVEATNNPFDAEPKWDDITEKVNRFVHVFTNATVTGGYGFGYRFYITNSGGKEVEVNQVTIRFA